jgi:hypothetical protein
VARMFRLGYRKSLLTSIFRAPIPLRAEHPAVSFPEMCLNTRSTAKHHKSTLTGVPDGLLNHLHQNRALLASFLKPSSMHLGSSKRCSRDCRSILRDLGTLLEWAKFIAFHLLLPFALEDGAVKMPKAAKTVSATTKQVWHQLFSCDLFTIQIWVFESVIAGSPDESRCLPRTGSIPSAVLV